MACWDVLGILSLSDLFRWRRSFAVRSLSRRNFLPWYQMSSCFLNLIIWAINFRNTLNSDASQFFFMFYDRKVFYSFGKIQAFFSSLLYHFCMRDTASSYFAHWVARFEKKLRESTANIIGNPCRFSSTVTLHIVLKVSKIPTQLSRSSSNALKISAFPYMPSSVLLDLISYDVPVDQLFMSAKFELRFYL